MATRASDDEISFQLLLRKRLDRETDLLFQRTAWVVGSQAFLFSAYAIAVNGHPAGVDLARKSHLLIGVIPWVSVISLGLFALTIGGGVVALNHLRVHVTPAAHEDPRLRILEPGPITRSAGMAAPLLIPAAFLLTWLVLLFSR